VLIFCIAAFPFLSDPIFEHEQTRYSFAPMFFRRIHASEFRRDNARLLDLRPPAFLNIWKNGPGRFLFFGNKPARASAFPFHSQAFLMACALLKDFEKEAR
jgi:hypothetical protein